MNQPKLIENTVYDFGGFVDDGVINILNNSDYIIIPLTSDLNSFKKTVSLLREIDNQNIIIVANRAEKTDFEEINNYFKGHFDFPIIEIKNSRIWVKTFKEKKSVYEIRELNRANKYIYRNSINGYLELLTKIKGEK
jgi:cellulose biosynthesis protein BcsQ